MNLDLDLKTTALSGESQTDVCLIYRSAALLRKRQLYQVWF